MSNTKKSNDGTKEVNLQAALLLYAQLPPSSKDWYRSHLYVLNDDGQPDFRNKDAEILHTAFVRYDELYGILTACNSLREPELSRITELITSL